jgi:O-antigen/teichoic acid export membrane protein
MLDLVISKVATTAVFIILVRLLSTDDIAAIGIATGYLVFISFLDVQPIRVLLRDYPSFADDRRARDELLTGMLAFWALQALAMLLLFAVVEHFALSRIAVTGIGFLFLALTVDFMALSLQGWVKTVLYAAFRQRVATNVGLVLTLARLASYVGVWLWPSLATYSWVLIILAIVSSVVWAVLLVRLMDYAPVWSGETPGILWRSVRSYGLWEHGNRMAVDTLFMIDTVVLSWLAPLSDIASYTIALKVNSLLFLLPMQLTRGLQLMLSHVTEDARRHRAINAFLKWNALLSLAQLAFIWLVGDWLLRLLFGVSGEGLVMTYTLIIAGAVTVMNMAWPLVAVVNNLCSLHRAFVQAYLPALVIGLAIYLATASRWGAYGIAWGNLAAYGVLFLALALFVRLHYPFRLAPQWLSPQERGLITELLRGRTS